MSSYWLSILNLLSSFFHLPYFFLPMIFSFLELIVKITYIWRNILIRVYVRLLHRVINASFSLLYIFCFFILKLNSQILVKSFHLFLIFYIFNLLKFLVKNNLLTNHLLFPVLVNRFKILWKSVFLLLLLRLKILRSILQLFMKNFIQPLFFIAKFLEMLLLPFHIFFHFLLMI